MLFVCSICAEESTKICVRCTKDACNNHLCEKCGRCSDCCECEVALDESPHHLPVNSARAMMQAVAAGALPEPEPELEPGPEPERELTPELETEPTLVAGSEPVSDQTAPDPLPAETPEPETPAEPHAAE